MDDDKPINDRIITILGFTGVLLGLIANIIANINESEYIYTYTFIQISITLAIAFLMTSIFIGLAIITDVPTSKQYRISTTDKETLFTGLIRSFLLGLLTVAISIEIIITKTPLKSITGMIALVVIFTTMIYITDKEINKKYITSKNEDIISRKN